MLPELLIENVNDGVPADDRGFLYGDSIFETMLCLNGTASHLDLHVARFVEGMRSLGFLRDASEVQASAIRAGSSAGIRDGTCDASDASDASDARSWVRNLLLNALAQRLPSHGNYRVRVTLSRGSGATGYAPAEHPALRLRTQMSELLHDPLRPLPPLSLRASTVFISEQPRLAGAKHGNRLEQVLAAQEAHEAGFDDAIQCRASGFVQCTSCANVFIDRHGVFVTPPVERCGIAGTRRRLIVDTLAPSIGVPVQEEEFTLRDLLQADGVFVTNSLVGIRTVSRVDDHELVNSELVTSFQDFYFRELRRSRKP
ncbi:MAG: aminotransferase class IV [Pseudomonadota bacterium]